MPGHQTTSDVLRSTAQAHPDRDAYVHGDRRISYPELDAAADAGARGLIAEGVRPGDVVMLSMPSSIDFAVAYLAAMRAGAITSAVNTRFGERERGSIVERTQPRVILEGQPSTAHTGDLPHIEESDVACIVWTSGTTGEPKGAVYDHTRLEAIARNMGALTRPGDRRLSVLPFPHVGYMTRVFDEISNGTTLVLTGEPWSAGETLRLVREEGITVMTGVPTQWALLLEHPDLASTDFSGVRLVGIGGASVAPELVGRIRESVGCPVIQRYTSTEAGITTGTSLDDPDEVVADTVGKPAPEVELLVIGGDGMPVDDGEVGEVVLRSPCMMREYWQAPDLTLEAIDPAGYLHTGDLGRFDDDANLRLVGRSKEMYVRGGYNVYPAEVEGALAVNADVERVAVVSAPDEVLGEIGVAFVVPTAGATPDRETLGGWLTGRIADYKRPDRVVLVDELPTTAMLKIDKLALAQQATAIDEQD